MYTLLKGLYNYINQKDEFSVLILGLDNAGKTTYLEQAKAKFNKNYSEANLKKITSTVGLNIGSIRLHGIKLNFWDLGGQEELQSLWDKYYAESHCLLYVVDSSDTDRFDDTRASFEKMIKSSALSEVPLMILANKQDLPECWENTFHLELSVQGSANVDAIRQVFHESYPLIGHRDCTVKGVSALQGEGIPETIEWCVNKVKQNSMKRPPRQKDLVL